MVPDATVTRDRVRSDASATAPHFVLALRCDDPFDPPARHCLLDLDEITIGRGAARECDRTTRRLVLRLVDSWMSSEHARLVRASGQWQIVDAGSKNGTLVNGHEVDRKVLCDGDLVELGQTMFVYRERLTVDGASDRTAPELAAPTPELATFRPELAKRFGELANVARSSVSVVVRGESGTGKEVVARALHALSGRTGSFVAVNCGALPATLVETELFGHRKGAFSGAIDDRPGLIRSADRGTLFLDEIGDLPLPAQAALLRVLQEREVLAVGATRPVAVDCRLAVATHRDLEAQVAAGTFRADLMARIAGFEVRMPPLRERREDLGLLIAALFRRHATRASFSCEAGRALFLHSWPLNVRELEKCLTTAIAIAGDAPIELAHLPDTVRTSAPLVVDSTDTRRAELVALLVEHAGNISAVARAMGKERIQIRRWLKHYGLDAGSFQR